MMKRVVMASMAVLALSASAALAGKSAHQVATVGERLNEAPTGMIPAGKLYNNNRELREMGLKAEDLIAVTTLPEIPRGSTSPRDLRPEGGGGYADRAYDKDHEDCNDDADDDTLM